MSIVYILDARRAEPRAGTMRRYDSLRVGSSVDSGGGAEGKGTQMR